MAEGGWTEKTKPSKMIMPNVEFFFLTATIPLPAHRTHPKPPPIPPRHHRHLPSFPYHRISFAMPPLRILIPSKPSCSTCGVGRRWVVGPVEVVSVVVACMAEAVRRTAIRVERAGSTNDSNLIEVSSFYFFIKHYLNIICRFSPLKLFTL